MKFVERERKKRKKSGRGGGAEARLTAPRQPPGGGLPTGFGHTGGAYLWGYVPRRDVAAVAPRAAAAAAQLISRLRAVRRLRREAAGGVGGDTGVGVAGHLRQQSAQ